MDEIHQELLGRLEPLGVKIARREILYLFEAYCKRRVRQRMTSRG